MFLRAGNDTSEARERIAAVDQRLGDLRAALRPTPCPEDARDRLDLAWALCWRGRYRDTLELIEPLTGEDFPADLAFEARQMLGDCHLRHDQYDLASRLYHENLDRARTAGEPYWCARADEGIAFCLLEVGHYTTGEFEEAWHIFERLTETYRGLGIESREGLMIYGLSRSVGGIGDYATAIDLAHDSVRALTVQGDEHLLHLPLLQLANIERDRGDFAQAHPLFEAALDAADRSQDPCAQVLAAHGFGTLLHYVGEIDQAVELWRNVMGVVKELELPRAGHEVSRKLALIAAERGEFKDAYELQQVSQEYGNRVGMMTTVLQSQQMMLREQIHQSAQLEDTLNNLKAGVEASIDGIFVLEKSATGVEEDEFIVRFVNDAAATMLKQRRAGIEHVLAKSVWRTHSAELLLAPSLEVFRTGTPSTFDSIQLEFSSAQPRWYSVKIAKIPTGVVWTVSDVTEHEEMQRQILAQRDSLSEANERLTSLDREKSEMLGMAAHDLRSPIGNIRSLCELIETGDPESQDLLKTIEEVADSLLSLIANLLDVERIERGEIDLKFAEVEVGALTSHLIEQFSAEASQKGIDIGFETPSDPARIRADESALTRILQNLISNALKFSPRGAPVFVRLVESQGAVRLEIQDRGKGITEADRSKLFRKFAKLSTRPTAGESSTGLGLSIVKQLVEAMHGRVGCDSEPGNGATFWVEFPSLATGATDSGSNVPLAA